MTIEVKGRRSLTPLATGAIASSSRPAGVPTLKTNPLPNGVSFFEDFVTPVITNAAYASGLTATPDTLVNAAPLGSPPWVATEIVGTTGTTNVVGTSISIGYIGLVQVASGTTSGNTMAVEYGAGSAAPANLHWDSTHSCLGMCRFSVSSATSRIVGVGLIQGLTVGADWVTDPDTTLATKTALVLHSNSGAYSGDTAGDMVLRYYEASGVKDTSVLVTASAGLSTGHHKYEIYVDGPAALAYLYFDGALVSGFPIAVAATGGNLHWSVQAQTGTAAARRVDVDCFYWEQQLTTAR